VTIIADTCGFHHMLAGACSSFTNEKRDGVNNTKTCRDNPAAAPKPSGIAGKDVPVNMSVFMNARLAGTETGRSRRPGARSATTSTFAPKWR
jgi:uncharacterized protein YcgI (DUF1989 family)